MVTDIETKVAKPVAYLYKGMTFGVSTGNFYLITYHGLPTRRFGYSPVLTFLQELAIAHRTKRQSTVIAKEIIELLSIDAEVTTISQ